MAMMTVIEIEEAWHVADGAGATIAGPFKSNAEAWRYFDRQSGDPVSRGEAVSSWIMSRAGTDDRQAVLPKLKRPSVRDRLRRKWRRMR
jgi:hypothetical protein